MKHFVCSLETLLTLALVSPDILTETFISMSTSHTVASRLEIVKQICVRSVIATGSSYLSSLGLSGVVVTPLLYFFTSIFPLTLWPICFVAALLRLDQ